MEFSKAVSIVVDQWITVHPNGKGTKGTPVEIDGQTGEILHGMGGKYNGKHISEAYKDIKKHEQGASAVIAKKRAEINGFVSKETVKNAISYVSERIKKVGNKKNKKNANSIIENSKFGEKSYRSSSSMTTEELKQDKSKHLVPKSGKVKIERVFSPIFKTTSSQNIIGQVHVGGHMLDVSLHPTGRKQLTVDYFGNAVCVGTYPNDMPYSEIVKIAEDDLNFVQSMASINGFKEASITQEIESLKTTNLHEYAPNSIGVGGARRGEKMSHKTADGMSVNPKYKTAKDYSVNCQTCVLAYEARRRGFDVEATGNNKKGGSLNLLLSVSPEIAYVDKETGKCPDPIGTLHLRGGWSNALPSEKAKAIFDAVGENNRGIFSFVHKKDYGHVISVVCDEGSPFLYDPQSGKEYKTKDDFFDFFMHEVAGFRGIVNTNNCDLNLEFADKILRKKDDQ